MAVVLNRSRTFCWGGLVHRDLKPDNMMIGEFGEVTVMDWGLAKVLSREPEEHDSEFISDDTYQTLPGRVKGTPRYMAPEQAKGISEEVDEVLKRVATGTIDPPTSYNHRHSTSVSVSGDSSAIRPPVVDHCPDRRIPSSLSAVTIKALDRKKGERYQTVAEFQDDIRSCQEGFATTAEEAVAFTMFWLLIKRHRTEASRRLSSRFSLPLSGQEETSDANTPARAVSFTQKGTCPVPRPMIFACSKFTTSGLAIQVPTSSVAFWRNSEVYWCRTMIAMRIKNSTSAWAMLSERACKIDRRFWPT